jgi:hypothetical protein
MEKVNTNEDTLFNWLSWWALLGCVCRHRVRLGEFPLLDEIQLGSKSLELIFTCS